MLRGNYPTFVDDLLAINECGVNSLVSNSFINAKVSEKKLTFGIDKANNIAKKCRKIHTGRENELCPPFKADYAGVPSESSEKYLGDIISSDGKLEKTIKMREAKGNGAISQIMAILKNVSLGNHYFEITKDLHLLHKPIAH